MILLVHTHSNSYERRPTFVFNGPHLVHFSCIDALKYVNNRAHLFGLAYYPANVSLPEAGRADFNYPSNKTGKKSTLKAAIIL